MVLCGVIYGICGIVELCTTNKRLSMTDLMIRKSHPIVEAGYKLSLAEQRIILLSLAKLDNRDIEQSKVTLYAKDYAESFGVSEKVAYIELNKASKRLYDRSIILRGEDETTEFRWIESRTRYHSGEGRISFEFSRRVLPYLFELDKKIGYTQYHLLSVSGFNSTYSIRVYELCKKILGMQNQTIEVSEIRRMLQLEGKYKEYREFNKFVLKVAINEINEKSDLFVEVEQIKRGRSIHALKFLISSKKQATQAVENTENLTKSGRPKLKKGTDAEAKWARECIEVLEDWRKTLKERGEKLSTSDLELLRSYHKITGDWYTVEKITEVIEKRQNKENKSE